MAAKLKVQDVLSEGKRVGLVGNGKTPHILRADTPTPAAQCNGKAATEADNLPGELNICANCAKVNDKITELDNKESETMAENTETETPKTDAEILAEVTRDVEAAIEALSKLTKADGDKITATQAQANAELLKVSANKRAPLSMQLKAAVAEAKGRTTTTAVAVRAETTDVTTIEGYAEIVDHTAEKMAEGIRAEVSAQETARTLAEAILDARLRVFDKKGRPDLKGTRQASKDLTNEIKGRAAKKLVDSGYASTIADTDDLMDSLQAKITYQMSAVLPEFVRALDDSPEQFAELFPMYADKVTEDTPASEVIFKEYNINKESFAERAARKRREKTLTSGNGSAGELESGEGAEGAEGETAEGAATESKGQFDKDKERLSKIGKDLVSVVDHAKEYTDEQRETLRKELTDALTAITDALTKLS
ncbi:hypothetical protein CPT_Shaeky_022 [Streptomyces phage Shaeky]|uniref:Immunity repressor n=1 Tax=Streptomyces phage Shaeky TaxID=2767586 RepID=A0A873WE14_9CAUD|nr:hypothetical protein CPT_Shaeky_022 [Streptomyces phage Shaeky]